MIILHKSTPSSLLKAALLSRQYKGTCLHNDEFSTSLLKNSFGSEILDAQNYSLQKIRSNYEANFGPVGWLDSPRSRQLSTAVFYAARYRAADRYRLIINVIRQALEHGLDYVLCRVSPDSRNMMNRSRRVCMELHRAYGFIRFEPICLKGAGEVLVGKAEFQNDICDLVLKYFSRRYTKQSVYLTIKSQVFFLENNVLQTKDINDLSFKPGETFSAMWEAYYDSQFIEGRKNPALARKHLPKKYWSWVPEGEKLT